MATLAAAKVLLPPVTNYLCEHGFSALNQIEINLRNKLNPEHNMRCSISTLISGFDTFVVGE